MLVLDPKPRITVNEAHRLLARDISCDERCSYDPERLTSPHEGVNNDSDVWPWDRISTEQTEGSVVEAMNMPHEFHHVDDLSSIDFTDKA